MTKLNDALLLALPERIPFYHLGEIIQGEDAGFEPNAEEVGTHRAAAVTVQGDLRAVIAVVFPAFPSQDTPGEWDSSAYLELTNLMAARAVGELARREGLDLMISPPRELSPRQLQALLLSPRQLYKTYSHRSPRRARLRVYIFRQTPAIRPDRRLSGNA